MPAYELTTIMKRESPAHILLLEGLIVLPLELKIYTSYNSWLRDGVWETKVIGINPNGRDFLMQTSATLDLPDRQHAVFVDKYKSMGYEIAEHRKPLTHAELGRLEKLLEGIPGLDEFGER